MKVVFTLHDILEIGMLGVFLIFAAICILVAVIDVMTKDWRYRRFKCPKCSKRNPETHVCGHFRNSGCDCEYFTEKKKERK